MVWWVGLQYSIVVFLNHAHILFPWVPHASLLDALQVLQSSCRKRDSKLLYFKLNVCAVMWMLVFCVTSTICQGLVSGL